MIGSERLVNVTCVSLLLVMVAVTRPRTTSFPEQLVDGTQSIDWTSTLLVGA